MIVFSSSLFAQTSTTITGKIDSLKDAWGEIITYIGDIKGGKPNGLGMAIYHNDYALRYAGYFVNGKYEGKGALVFSDGSFISGDWKAGKLNGKGANFNKDKDLYVGGFSNGLKNGFGTFMFADNSFLQGGFKDDNYSGRCIFVNSSGNVLSDNIYADSKKDGPGYQYELDSKKLFEGIWKNGDWQESTTGNYYSFLKDSRFYAEKTDDQIIIGSIDKNNNSFLEDTSFYYDKVKHKRYFGYNHNGLLENGLIIKDDSSRFIGTLNDDGAYGYCSFLKMGKFYDEGNYVKDYLSGDNSLSINIEKKTIYYGQTIGQAEFSGKAWFASSSNDLYDGMYKNGKFTGTGRRMDKSGYCVKGNWEEGKLITLTSLTNNRGELVNTNPKTLSEALSITCNAFYGEFLGLQGEDDDSYDLDWLDLPYQSVVSFPGTETNDRIVEDYDSHWFYIATYKKSDSFEEAKTEYNNLVKQVANASITVKKGAAPVKLIADKDFSQTADEETDFVLSQFTLPEIAKGPAYFTVSVVLKTNEDDEYMVMIVCGDDLSVQDWEY